MRLFGKERKQLKVILGKEAQDLMGILTLYYFILNLEIINLIPFLLIIRKNISKNSINI